MADKGELPDGIPLASHLAQRLLAAAPSRPAPAEVPRSSGAGAYASRQPAAPSGTGGSPEDCGRQEEQAGSPGDGSHEGAEALVGMMASLNKARQSGAGQAGSSTALTAAAVQKPARAGGPASALPNGAQQGQQQGQDLVQELLQLAPTDEEACAETQAYFERRPKQRMGLPPSSKAAEGAVGAITVPSWAPGATIAPSEQQQPAAPAAAPAAGMLAPAAAAGTHSSAMTSRQSAARFGRPLRPPTRQQQRRQQQVLGLGHRALGRCGCRYRTGGAGAGAEQEVQVREP